MVPKLASLQRLAAMEPVSQRALAVLVNRLWEHVGYPMSAGGDERADARVRATMIQKLGAYPEDLVAMAVERVIETYRRDDPPKVAHLLELIEPEARKRKSLAAKIRTMRLWVARGRVERGPATPVTPEERARNLALIRSALKSLTSPQSHDS